MREGLRSSSLKRRFDSESRRIPDLNVVTSEEVSRIDGEFDAVISGGKSLRLGEDSDNVDVGMEVENECRKCESQRVKCCQNDICEGRLEADDGGENDEVEKNKFGSGAEIVDKEKDVLWNSDVLGASGDKVGSIDEDGQGRSQVVGKVLRSRVVLAGRIGENSRRKRKRGMDGKGEEAASLKVENGGSAIDSEDTWKQMSLVKFPGPVEEEAGPIGDAPVVSRVEQEDAGHNVVYRPKRKRGRPWKYVDCRPEKEVQTNLVLVKSEVAKSSSKFVGKLLKRKRGRPRKVIDHPIVGRIQMDSVEVAAGVEDEDLTVRLVGSQKKMKKKKGKRGRPRKNFSCPVKEAVDGEADDDTGDVGSESVSKRGRKRRRPKRFTGGFGNEIVEMKKVPFCDLDEEIEDDADNLCNKSVRNPKKKGKRGRPKKQKGTEVVKKIPFKRGKVNNDGKMKISLRKGPIRISRFDNRSRRAPGKKEMLSLEDTKSVVSQKSEETPMCQNNTSLKRKRVKTHGAVSVEKNMIRNRIVDMLLDAGWRVEYRPRQGRDYSDAVYVNPEGKAYWSVTKAYFIFKEEVESGKVGPGASNTNFQFSPIPEEVLSKLFRVVSKTRSDKSLRKKKKHNYDTGDSSDEEFTRDKSVKRKYSARDGTPSKRRCALLVRQTHHGSNSVGDGVIAYSGKNSVLAWMIDSGIVPLDGKVQYMNRRKTKAMLEGSVTKDGIHCSCCKQVISVSEFENHSGSKLCERYANVLLESGHSLLQCQLDAWNKQEEKGRSGYYSVPVEGDDPNDDTCGICGDGGDLMCCDGCPSTFHHDCLNIEEVPSGEWHCVYCSCKFCGSVGETASERDDDCDTTAISMATCSLCHGKYHRSCSDEVDAVCVESKQLSFCGHICKQIFEQLQSLVGAKHDLDDGFSWTLLQRSDIEADTVNLQPEKILCNSKLAVALAVMDECFLPIIDPRSDINLIRHIIYSCGSNFNRLNFSNFFTVILERGDELISAASVRILGKGLAEMPFIGTRNIYRRQGMCRRLLNAIELALGSLEVEKLVIPAVSELMHTWTSVFNFEPLEESVQQEMRSISMLVFPHTGMLQKRVSKQQIVKKTIPVTDENVKCHESGNEFSDVGVDKSEVDDGSVNGKFDLNCAAPELPESSIDERHLVSPAGNCEDEVKSGMNMGEISDANNLQSQSLENKEDQAGASSLIMSSEGRTLQPDLNIMEENIFGEEEKTQVHHCSAFVNLDGAVKSKRNSSDLTNVDGLSLLENGSDLKELPKSELDSDGTNCHGVSTLDKMRENHRFPVDKMGPSSSVMGCNESEVGCSNNGNSDVHGKEVAEAVVKSTRNSYDLTDVDGSSLLENGSDLNEIPKSELDSDGTNCHGVSTLDKMIENHKLPIDKMGPSSSVMGCNESEVGCSNNGDSDVHGKEVAESVVKSTKNSCDLTNVDGSSLLENGSDLNELPKSELDSDVTKCHGVSTLDKMRENHIFPVDKMGPSLSVMGCNESEEGCSNNGNSDVHGKEVAELVVKSTRNSSDLTDVDGSLLLENGSDLNELPKSELDSYGTNCHGVSPMDKTRENHRFSVDKMGPSSSVMGCYESEVGCCNNGNSDVHGKEVTEAVVKSTINSSDLIDVDGSYLLENGSDLNELPKSELDSDGTSCHGVSTLDKMIENHRFPVDKMGPSSSVMGCYESVGCSNNGNSDVHGKEVAESIVNGENGSPTLKFVPESESPKTIEEFTSDETRDELCSKSSDSQMDLTSLEQLKSR